MKYAIGGLLLIVRSTSIGERGRDGQLGLFRGLRQALADAEEADCEELLHLTCQQNEGGLRGRRGVLGEEEDLDEAEEEQEESGLED